MSITRKRVDLRPQGDANTIGKSDAIVRLYGMGFLPADPGLVFDPNSAARQDELDAIAAANGKSSPSSPSGIADAAAAWIRKNQNNVLIASGALLALAVLSGSRRRR